MGLIHVEAWIARGVRIFIRHPGGKGALDVEEAVELRDKLTAAIEAVKEEPLAVLA